jgi:hypothetical protein
MMAIFNQALITKLKLSTASNSAIADLEKHSANDKNSGFKTAVLSFLLANSCDRDGLINETAVVLMITLEYREIKSIKNLNYSNK